MSEPLKESEHAEIRIDVEGDVIVVRVKGKPTVEIVRHYHAQLVSLIREKGLRKVLYDGLAIIVPPVDVALELWKLERQLDDIKLKRAVLLPPAVTLAYLAGVAFAESEYRIFYENTTAAMQWLASSTDEMQSGGRAVNRR